MSKILYICYRSNTTPANIKEEITESCNRINADNIRANPSHAFQQDNVAYGISNPVNTFETKARNVLFGKLFQEGKNWQTIKEDYPDGNYVIFRANEEFFEVVTDEVSTRTVWYYQDNEKLLVSTSQRAMIHFLGNFQFDDKVIPWLLSTGSLGPEDGWDKRIKRLEPGSLLLTFSSWQLKIEKNSVDFVDSNASDEEYEKSLTASIRSTFKNLKFDYSKWALAFSGGHDSRGILAMLDRTKSPDQKVKTITWGSKNAQKEVGTDAQVASEVAQHLRTNHTYFAIDYGHEAFADIVERFLKNGEGRIDHISSYIDGFQIWKTLFESKVEGVIRGNQVFVQKKPPNAFAVRYSMGIPLCSDFKNIQQFPYIRSLQQYMPPRLEQKEGETISTWGDRLMQEYRLPVVQAALSDLKFPYVDQFEPLLSRQIILESRRLPDHLRNGKSLFRKIVESLNPNIRYATKSATINKQKLFAQPDFLKLIIEELHTPNARSIFPEVFIEEVMSKINKEEKEQKETISILNIKKFIAVNLPLKWKEKIYGTVISPTLDLNTFAFRIFIICRMHRILLADAGKTDQVEITSSI